MARQRPSKRSIKTEGHVSLARDTDVAYTRTSDNRRLEGLIVPGTRVEKFFEKPWLGDRKEISSSRANTEYFRHPGGHFKYPTNKKKLEYVKGGSSGSTLETRTEIKIRGERGIENGKPFDERKPTKSKPPAGTTERRRPNSDRRNRSSLWKSK